MKRAHARRAADDDLGIVREQLPHERQKCLTRRRTTARPARYDRYIERPDRVKLVKLLDGAYVDVKIAEIE